MYKKGEIDKKFLEEHIILKPEYIADDPICRSKLDNHNCVGEFVLYVDKDFVLTDHSVVMTKHKYDLKDVHYISLWSKVRGAGDGIYNRSYVTMVSQKNNNRAVSQREISEVTLGELDQFVDCKLRIYSLIYAILRKLDNFQFNKQDCFLQDTDKYYCSKCLGLDVKKKSILGKTSYVCAFCGEVATNNIFERVAKNYDDIYLTLCGLSQTATENPGNSKKCSNCGKMMPQNANFCTACGTKMS
ncbi:zinc ribbon domain-containing protein [Butyrivibrio sp. INlla14]|uniref:zinc ribbon domain-containing protein n=1 Tax=Butyrivibrio sp. INlla14 TaxID=1520808 RepID=UPI000876E8FB|nr:zinc ribbon domain-containing protein [Butyrivibrio sp. INlla14]SCY57731.1 zinc-ribbon domain-containing protein [Butyrivibrio sp. INlla14]